MEQFIYDLTSYEKARDSLSKLVGINKIDIEVFLHKNANDYDCLYKRFIELFNIDVESLDISKLYLKIMQVTTNGDNCQSIKRYGLLNTQDAIKEDTYLGNFLISKGIEVDFDNEIIKYNGRKYCRTSKINHKIDLCCTKLFSKCHYPINAFIYSDNPLNYGGGVKERPELISNFADVFGDCIEKEWINSTKCFLIIAKVSIYDLDYSVFCDWQDTFEDDKDNIIKEWLISRSLDVMHDLKIKSSHSDIYAYLKPELKIQPENIIQYINDN